MRDPTSAKTQTNIVNYMQSTGTYLTSKQSDVDIFDKFNPFSFDNFSSTFQNLSDWINYKNVQPRDHRFDDAILEDALTGNID